MGRVLTGDWGVGNSTYNNRYLFRFSNNLILFSNIFICVVLLSSAEWDLMPGAQHCLYFGKFKAQMKLHVA